MSRVFSYTAAPPLGARANLGLVVLQTDETLEHEFRHLIPGEGVALYVTRIASAPEVSRASLADMEARLPHAAGLLPQAVRFDAVGYGCTSASSVIGSARVAELVAEGCETRHVTNPLAALVAACRALQVTRLALLSPYVAQVSEGLRQALRDHGIETPVFGSFDEAEETRVARIDAASLCEAARALASDGGVDALFLSCTNLRTREIIAPLEQDLGLPVLSSNQVLAWHMMRQAGLRDAPERAGRLFAL